MISVIIPVYNSEKCIDRCLQSIIDNTYKDLEIICVNDGSTDKSSSIIRTYQKLDKRIKIFSKQNGGVSSARNIGLSKATGKYVCFIDADDSIDPNYFSVFIKEFENNDIQLCINGYKKINLSTNQITKVNYTHTFLSGYEIVNDIFNSSTGALWNKMFLREIIIKYNISFNESISYCEDIVFLVQYITKISKAVKATTSTYNYYYTPIAEKYNYENLKTRLLAIESIIKEIQTNKQLSNLTKKLKTEYIVRQNNFNNKNISKPISKHPTYLFSLLTSENTLKFKIFHLLKFLLKF